MREDAAVRAARSNNDLIFQHSTRFQQRGRIELKGKSMRVSLGAL